jgi:hypothetical protein
VRVAAENQHAKLEPFQVWTVDIGQWGGRELASEDPNPSKNSLAVSEVSLKDWMAPLKQTRSLWTRLIIFNA